MSQPSPAHRRGVTTLVVDDDARNRRLLEGLLRADGYRVLSAADGEAALRLAREQRPQVILLDVMMPGLTGHEVCARLKADPTTRACQVMLVTALDAEPDRVTGLDVGADDYAAKPVRRAEFLAKVRALVRARGLLDELERERTLAACTVHDLKSPLASLLGTLELLGRRVHEDPRATEMVARCLRSSRRMQAMVHDMLDIDRLVDGRLAPRRRTVDVVDLLRAAATEAEPRAEHAEVELVVDDGVAAEASVDPSLVRRVVDNLVGNALDHAPRASRVTLRAATEDDELRIEVLDAGPGVPPELREAVFEKYARGALDGGGVCANRGLGLTFCRLAVEAHGGSVAIDDGAAGRGTLVRARFPGAAVPVAVGAR